MATMVSRVSVRELGTNLRNCVSSNPHFFLRVRSRDRSLGLDKLVSGGKVTNYLGSASTLEESTWTVAKRALHWGTRQSRKVERAMQSWLMAMQCRRCGMPSSHRGGTVRGEVELKKVSVEVITLQQTAASNWDTYVYK